ncbi:APC family permease [Celerinatantimonas yamalensis]|uniref:APC family permease n=1 Tax=Celerinatantimonas yamalensis TaxID=559956 RepID=A0ABW9G9R2_9GAMM
MENSTALRRVLTLPHLVLFGLAYMAPMIVFGIYGLVAQTTEGMSTSAYIVALIAMLFTALSYGQMVKAFPVSGSAYTYTRKALNGHLGFMVGWGTLLDYLFIPMAIWLIGSAYLNAAFPAIPSWAWVLAFIVVTTFLNILGIKYSMNVNMLLMGFQLLVVALFIILAVRGVQQGQGLGTLFSLQPLMNHYGHAGSAILSGAAIGCYSFLGFDAITTMTEESQNPTKTIPRAIILVTCIGGGIFILASYVTTLVHPDLHFKDVDSAAFAIAKQIGGALFSAIFLAGLIVAQFCSGISAQASASRLLYAMGRDGVLPESIFGQLHPKYQTPVANILLVAVIGLLALTMNVSTSTSFINFGAFIAFTLVNVSVIFHYFIHGKRRGFASVVYYLLFPASGAICDFWLLTSLDSHAIELGVVWALIGVGYLAFITRGFQNSPPELDETTIEAHA